MCLGLYVCVYVCIYRYKQQLEQERSIQEEKYEAKMLLWKKEVLVNIYTTNTNPNIDYYFFGVLFWNNLTGCIYIYIYI